MTRFYINKKYCDIDIEFHRTNKRSYEKYFVPLMQLFLVWKMQFTINILEACLLIKKLYSVALTKLFKIFGTIITQKK